MAGLIPISAIPELKEDALNALLKRYSKRANSRIERLRRNDLWNKSAVIQRHWNTVTHTTPVGTPSGRFSRSVTGSRQQREMQLTQIIKFLKAKTTVKDVKIEIAKRRKALFGDDGGNDEYQWDENDIWTLFNEYYDVFRAFGISSNQEKEVLIEISGHMPDKDSAREFIDNAMANSKTNDDFARRVTKNFEWYDFNDSE